MAGCSDLLTRRGVAHVFVIGAALIALSGCGQQTTFRYKMTVEVETPEGLRSGHAVREVRFSEPGNFPSIGESKPQWGVKGEAVAVDLPRGKVLFALLKSGDGVFDYAGRDIDHMFREFGGKQIQLWPNPPKTMAPRINDPLPMLVTFADLKDPMNLQRVDPDELAAAFGDGVRLRRITVQLTEDEVTAGIEKKLPWLDHLEQFQSNPNNVFSSTLPEEIGSLRSNNSE